jgi:hypothetical protein
VPLPVVCRCVAPDAEGWVSVAEEKVELPGSADRGDDDDDAVDDVGEDELIEARSFRASGVENKFIDFWQNFRADGMFPASRCRWAMVRQRKASSLFPSIRLLEPKAVPSTWMIEKVQSKNYLFILSTI